MPCDPSVPPSKCSPVFYDPTPTEIAAACRRIRAKWSPSELAKRSSWAITPPVTVAVIDDEWSAELRDE